MLYAFFWVIPQCLNFIFLHRQIRTYLPMNTGQSVLKRQHIKFKHRDLPRRKHTTTLKLFLCKPWRHVVEEEVWLHSFLTLVLGGDELSTSCSGQLTPQERTLVLTRRLGSPQSWSRHFAEDKTLLPLPTFEPQITQPIV